MSSSQTSKTSKTSKTNKNPIRKAKKKKFKKVKILSNPPQAVQKPTPVSITEEDKIEMYKESLNDLELKVLEIAQTHLKTSFDMEKSIGYLKWKKVNHYN